MNKDMILDALNSRYCCLKEPLTSLRVFGTREDDEPHSPQTLSQHIIDQQILKKKITAAISALSFRDPHVLVQFWSPVTVRKRCWLALDQPFGIGVVNEALYKYRLESEKRMFAVDGEHIEELVGSPGRVYRQKLPEWSLDIQGLPTSQNIKDSIACHNINGYISLPVVDPASGCCVGVLELITLSKHVDYAFEVKEISKALKEQDLKTSNAFEEPSFCELPSEDRKIQIAKINDILKVMCDTYNLPLAQTWELSPLSSHVLHEKSMQKSCSSFNSRCIGKVCMSTAGLPFYVRDLSMWEFHKACMEQHLEKSQGVVGRALLSHCASYCEDVTKLSEEEYPLVRNACTSGLGGCFAIFLRGVGGKNDYILEFFMPLDIKDSIGSYVLNLVQKLKLKIEDASGFEMGDISSMEVIRPPSVVTNISSMTEVDTPNGIIPHPFVTNVATIACGAYVNMTVCGFEGKNNYILEVFITLDIKDSIGFVLNVVQQLKLMIEDSSDFEMGDISSIEVIRPPSVVNNISSMTEVDTPNGIIPHQFLTNVAIACDAYTNLSMHKTRDKGNDAGEPSRNCVIRNIKCKRDSLTMVAVEKLFGLPMDEACKSLGVSRSTLKRFLRGHNIPRWPVSMHSNRNACVTDSIQQLPVSMVTERSACVQNLYRQNPPIVTSACGAYANVSMQKTRDKGNGAGEPSNRLTRNIKRKRGSLTMEAVEKQVGQPMDEAIKSLGGRGRYLSKSTLHVYHVAKLIVRLRCWKKRSFVRIATAHQDDSLVFEKTTNTEQATINVDPLMARTAMAHQNDPVVFDDTIFTEQTTNNVDPLMDVNWDKVTDLNSVDAIRMLSGADFIDNQGSSWMEPDGIENSMAEIGMGLEGTWSPPIGSGDMYLFGANPSDYDFSDLVFDDRLF